MRLGQIGAFLSFLLLPSIAIAEGKREITFFLAPEAHWNDGRPARDALLPDGEILLFRQGSYEPEVIVQANEPTSIPAGDWTWIAQAPGYVSVQGGLLRLDSSRAVKKEILWRVVPACELDLSSQSWNGVSRLDAVSLSRGATYPVDVRQRQRLNVPAGPFLAYTVDPRGVQAISAVLTCVANTTRPVRRPVPPPHGQKDVMLTGLFPETVGVHPGDLDVDLRSLQHQDLPGLSPTAVAWSRGFATFFFLGVPADAAQVRLRHPELASVDVDLPELDGGVIELEQSLTPRLRVEVPIDYRPSREHQRAVVALLSCGSNRRAPIEACQPSGKPQPLVPGLAIYTFEKVDAGKTILEARIDDERVIGLGNGSSFSLEASDGPIILLPQESLEEFHVYGHLLVDGEPVPGEVRLESLLTKDRYATRRFPTRDDDLTFNLFYFGQKAPEQAVSSYPAALREGMAGDIYGMPLLACQIQGCDTEGFCRLLHAQSQVFGSGRFDIDLSGSRLQVTVRDADTDNPVGGALVALPPIRGKGHRPVFVFDGRIEQAERSTGEALTSYTDKNGRAQIRATAASFDRIVVTADGYETRRASFEWSNGGSPLEIEIALERPRKRDRPRLLLASGGPADGAVVLGLAEDGGPDYACLRVTDDLGQLDFPDFCFADEDRALVAFHRNAALTLLSAGLLRRAPEHELEAATAIPIRVRLRDGEGLPLAGTTIALRFPEFVLGPNHLIATRQGHATDHRTNELGDVTLPFLSRRGALPDLLLPQLERAFPLFESESGAMIEIIVE